MGTERDVEYENSPLFSRPPHTETLPVSPGHRPSCSCRRVRSATPKELARVRASSLRGNSKNENYAMNREGKTQDRLT